VKKHPTARVFADQAVVVHEPAIAGSPTKRSAQKSSFSISSISGGLDFNIRALGNVVSRDVVIMALLGILAGQFRQAGETERNSA
jgi:hypothetical protein